MLGEGLVITGHSWGEGQKGRGGGGGENGQLTCGYPLPLAPTDPPDDVIAHQRVLALLQANTIFVKHKNTIQLDAVVAPQCLFQEDVPGVGPHAFLSLELYQEASIFSPEVVFLHPKMFVHDQG